MPYTKDEFLGRLVKKYPEYESWDKDELYTKVLTKYPEYIPQITDYTETYSNNSQITSENAPVGDSTQEAEPVAEQAQQELVVQPEDNSPAPAESTATTIGGMQSMGGDGQSLPLPSIEQAKVRNRVDELVETSKAKEASIQDTLNKMEKNIENSVTTSPEWLANKATEIGRSVLSAGGTLMSMAGAGVQLLSRKKDFTGEEPDASKGMFQYVGASNAELGIEPPVSALNEKMFEFGGAVREFGNEFEEKYRDNYELKSFEWTDLGDSRFYTTKGAKQLAVILPIIAATYATRGKLVSKYGASAIPEIAAGVAGREIESAMEATGTYNSLIQQGASEEKAAEAASDVYKKNMGLAVLDIAQTAVAFGKLHKLFRPSFAKFVKSKSARGGAVGASVLSEAPEELIQNYFADQASAIAMGEPDIDFIKAMKFWATPEQREVFVMSILMGAGFQAGGSVLSKQEIDTFIDDIADDYGITEEDKKSFLPDGDASKFAPEVNPEDAGVSPKSTLERNQIIQKEAIRQKRESVTADDLKDVGETELTPSEISGNINNLKNSDPEEFWSVSPVSEQEASDGTIITVAGGGGVVTRDGDIIGIHSLGTNTGVAKRTLKKAIEAGGVKLDAYDIQKGGAPLQRIYEEAGFRVAGRTPFNEEFADDGWSEEKHGRPDVIAMVYDPDGKLDIREKTFTDKEQGYNEALAYRDLYTDKDASPEGNLGDISTLPFDVAETKVKEPFVEKLKDSHKAIIEIDDTISKIEERIAEGNDPSLFEASQKEIEELSQLRADIVNEINALPRRSKIDIPLDDSGQTIYDIDLSLEDDVKSVPVATEYATAPPREPVAGDTPVKLNMINAQLLKISRELEEVGVKYAGKENAKIRKQKRAEIQQRLNDKYVEFLQEQDSRLKIEDEQDVKPSEIADATLEGDALAEESLYTPANDITQKRKVYKETQRRKIFAPMSDRFDDISPVLKEWARRYEFNVLDNVHQDLVASEPFMRKFKKLKKDDHDALDIALKNGDNETASEIMSRNNMTTEYEAVVEILEGLKQRAVDSGYQIGEIDNYFPRRVEDYKGLLEYFGKDPELEGNYQKRIREAEAELGRPLAEDEKTVIANTVMRGFHGKTNAKNPSGTKSRTIETVSKGANDNYYDSINALYMHIHDMNEGTEQRKALGVGAKADGKTPIPEEAIGNFVSELIESGEINASQQTELEGLIRSRFNVRGMSAGTQAIRDIGLITTLSDVTNSITQLGDIAWAMYQGGMVETVKALSVKKLGKNRKDFITKEDAGIDNVIEELNGKGGLSKALDNVLSATGFKVIDSVGKETLINATMNRIKKEVDSGKLAPKTKDILDAMFTNESQRAEVLQKIKDGTLDEKTRRYMAFFTMSEFQPISRLEVPQSYLDAPNGRLLYTLKTFTIKQLAVYRREAIKKIQNGDVKTGMKNLIHLSVVLMLANATKDEMKDALLGKSESMSDLVFENILTLMGLSRYGVRKASKDGLGKLAVDTVAPPTNFFDDIYKDLVNINKGKAEEFEDFNAVKYIPAVGDFLYYRYGKGRKMEAKYADEPPTIDKMLEDMGFKESDGSETGKTNKSQKTGKIKKR